MQVKIPANNGDIYSTEQALYYDDVRLNNTINWTCIIEASTDGTGIYTYVRYVLSRDQLVKLDDIGEAANKPRIRLNSAGNCHILMDGETKQEYAVNVIITRL